LKVPSHTRTPAAEISAAKQPLGHKRTAVKPVLLWLVRRRGGISTAAEDGVFVGGVWRRIEGVGAREGEVLVDVEEKYSRHGYI
jgi:hypothetical protein